MPNGEPILKVKGLKQHFVVSSRFTVRAVDGVDFVIYPGETYGLVGESGSGKSTIGRSLIRLYKPTSGSIEFNGMDISGKMNRSSTERLRTEMQMIFQDPMACLNPRKKVGEIIAQGLDLHHLYKTRAERAEKVAAMLKKVGLAPEHADRFDAVAFRGADEAAELTAFGDRLLGGTLGAGFLLGQRLGPIALVGIAAEENVRGDDQDDRENHEDNQGNL